MFDSSKEVENKDSKYVCDILFMKRKFIIKEV